MPNFTNVSLKNTRQKMGQPTQSKLLTSLKPIIFRLDVSIC